MAPHRQQSLPAGIDIDGFAIRRVIGTGGFGITYLAFDTSLERPVAIKEYCPHDIARRGDEDTTLQPAHPDVRDAYEYGLGRFLDEARTLARFHHPSIVRVHRFLKANGTAYLIMEFEEGRTLHRVLEQGPRLDEQRLLHLLLPLLEGLEMVHEESFLHRDIKPANIVMRERGTPVLLDFGAARMALEAQEGDLTVMLTPGYAPLEQYSSTDQQGPWSDIYALGATAYHCMTGTAPPSATDRIARVHTSRPDPVPETLRPLAGTYSNLLLETVLWMLEPVAARRPQSAGELVRALRPMHGIAAYRHDRADDDDGPATRVAADFVPTPALTRGLEAELCRHAGRIGQRVVAPAVAQATRFEELVEHLAGFVLDPGAEAEFRAAARTLREDPATAAGTGGPGSGAPRAPARTTVAEDPDIAQDGYTAAPAPSRPPTTRSLHDEVVRHAEHHLAELIGPIASLLVEQAAGQATTREQFLDLLAEELDDEAERKAFLARVK